MSDRFPVPPRRIPFAVASLLAVVAGVVAIAVGVNHAATAEPTPAPTAVPTPTPTPTPAVYAFASCAGMHFGPALAPLNEPKNVHVYAAQPPMTIDVSKLYEMSIKTARGTIVLCLQPKLAPVTVNVIVTLARNHFYDGIPFHRVCPNSADTSCGGSLAIDQGGDPNCIGNVKASTCGQGGPGFEFGDEPVHQRYVTGAVAMANSGANTNGSQFFICTGDDTSLASSYNLFGNVASGLAVAQAIVKGDVMETVTVSESV